MSKLILIHYLKNIYKFYPLITQGRTKPEVHCILMTSFVCCSFDNNIDRFYLKMRKLSFVHSEDLTFGYNYHQFSDIMSSKSQAHIKKLKIR